MMTHGNTSGQSQTVEALRDVAQAVLESISHELLVHGVAIEIMDFATDILGIPAAVRHHSAELARVFALNPDLGSFDLLVPVYRSLAGGRYTLGFFGVARLSDRATDSASTLEEAINLSGQCTVRIERLPEVAGGIDGVVNRLWPENDDPHVDDSTEAPSFAIVSHAPPLPLQDVGADRRKVVAAFLTSQGLEWIFDTSSPKARDADAPMPRRPRLAHRAGSFFSMVAALAAEAEDHWVEDCTNAGRHRWYLQQRLLFNSALINFYRTSPRLERQCWSIIDVQTKFLARPSWWTTTGVRFFLPPLRQALQGFGLPPAVLIVTGCRDAVEAEGQPEGTPFSVTGIVRVAADDLVQQQQVTDAFVSAGLADPDQIRFQSVLEFPGGIDMWAGRAAHHNPLLVGHEMSVHDFVGLHGVAWRNGDLWLLPG